MKLKDKVALVTGAGRGIGRAISLHFAGEGAAVILAGKDENSLAGAADECAGLGRRGTPITTDVSSESSNRKTISEALENFGRIDILVNNAGVIGPTAPLTRVELDEWQQVLAVNLTGPFLLAKYCLPQMIERRSGCILNISSLAGVTAYPLRGPYAVSKWGLIGMAVTLAQEVGPYGITVNCIAPGPVRGARMTEVISRRAAELQRPAEEIESEYLQSTALKRMVEESDIAAVAVFLASEGGRNISGETIKVSAGYRT